MRRSTQHREQLTEGMNILKPRESIEDCLEFLAECLLGVFDLSCIEGWFGRC